MYSVVLHTATKAYSVAACKYTGLGNVNVVATEASVDVLTSADGLVISAKGKIVVVGYPFTIVLNCTVTGKALSFDLKNKSRLVTNKPSS